MMWRDFEKFGGIAAKGPPHEGCHLPVYFCDFAPKAVENGAAVTADQPCRRHDVLAVQRWVPVPDTIPGPKSSETTPSLSMVLRPATCRHRGQMVLPERVSKLQSIPEYADLFQRCPGALGGEARWLGCAYDIVRGVLDEVHADQALLALGALSYERADEPNTCVALLAILRTAMKGLERILCVGPQHLRLAPSVAGLSLAHSIVRSAEFSRCSFSLRQNGRHGCPTLNPAAGRCAPGPDSHGI